MAKPVGRPTKYTPELLAKAKKYLDWCEKNPIEIKKTKSTIGDDKESLSVEKELRPRLPNVAGFAKYIGTVRDTCYEWAKEHKEFSDTLEEVQNAFEDFLWENGSTGQSHSSIAKLGLAHRGYREKQDVTTDGKVLPTPILGNLAKRGKEEETKE